MQNFFHLLNINIDADSQQIKQAYRKLCKIYHPDVNPDKKDTEEVFKKIQIAYEVLSNPEKRRIYKQNLEKEYKRKQSQQDFIRRKKAQKVAQEKYDAFLRDLARKKQAETQKQQEAYEKELQRQAELRKQEKIKQQIKLEKLKKQELKERKAKRLENKKKQEILFRQQAELKKQRLKEKLEENAWTHTIIKNTIEDYQYFMLNFPNGKYLQEAQIRLHQLYQEEDYFNLREKEEKIDIIYEICEEGHLYESTFETCPYCEEEHEFTNLDMYTLRFWEDNQAYEVEEVIEENIGKDTKNNKRQKADKKNSNSSFSGGFRFMLFWFFLVFILLLLKSFWDS